MSELMISRPSQQAKDEMDRRSEKLNAYSFNSNMVATVTIEDGSIFVVSDSFLEEWTDPSGEKWIFMFCEHYPSMWFSADDVITRHTSLKQT